MIFRLFGNQTVYSVSTNEPLLIFSHNQFLLNTTAYRLIIAFCIWFFLVFMITIWRTICYLYFLNILKKSLKPVTDERLLWMLSQKQMLLHASQPIRLFQSDMLHMPFTSGIFNPFIVIPNEMRYEDLELILFHEITHIKNKDIFFRIVANVCLIVYWFYPPVYLLNRFFEQISELECDETVSQMLNYDTKKAYATLILKTAKYKSIYTSYSSFFNNISSYEERIDCIMKKRKSKAIKKWYFITATALFSIVSCLPVLAAPIPQMLSFTENVRNQIDPNTNIQILEGTISEAKEIILYDKQIELPNGEIIPFEDTDYARAIICNHNFISVIVSQHDRHNDNSCTVTEFNAKRCNKCGEITNLTLHGTHSYPTCPH